MKKDGVYFENLDSIRFIAALMVFLGHTILEPLHRFSALQDNFIKKLLLLCCSGGLGVSIFFVLSGFLITYLLISEHEFSGMINVRNFYIRRTLRIWPLYFAIIIFTFLVYPFLKELLGINTPLASRVLYYICFLSNFDVIHIEKFFPGRDAISQNVEWSVAVEEQFYLFWPLLFTFLPKKTWVYSILFVIVGSIIFRILHYDDGVVLYFHTFSVLMDLAIGALFAWLVQEIESVRRFFEQVSTLGHLFLFTLCVCVLLWANSILSFTEYNQAIARIFMSLSFALIITSQALTVQSSWLNLKNWTFAHQWGKYTYGIYLLHPIAMLIVDISKRVTHLSITSTPFILLFAGITFILTLVLSKLSYTFYEKPFLKLKKRFEIISATHLAN